MNSYHAMHLPWSPDWAALFGRSAPLVLEIGFGDGKFLTELAQQNPAHNIIGVERAHEPFTWAEKRVKRLALGNVKLVYGDALMALHCLFPPHSLSALHINFSDPWHKKRHHKRRVITPEFLRVAATRLENGAPLFIATDIAQYAGEIGLALAQTAGLKNAYPTPWMTHREQAGIATRYEQKAILAGRTCHYFKWLRRAAPLPPIPVYEEHPMPNIKLRLALDTRTILNAFQPISTQKKDRFTKIMAAYQDAGGDTLLFEALIEEPLFSQRLMVMLQRRGAEFLLQISSIGHPRTTPGVHDAINALAEWLLQQDPTAHIIESKASPA